MDKSYDKYTYTIKEIPKMERPREKLLAHGVETLSNVELLAILIRTGYRNFTALDLAEDIICLDESGIKNLSNITVDELKAIKGMGECKSAQIVAAIELGKRISSYRADLKPKVTSPLIIVDLFMSEMKGLEREHFRTINLNTKNEIISIEEISIGNLNTSIVHPREVFKNAIRKNSNSIILMHNHPSGDPTPSKEDIDVTYRLISSGNILGIKVLDHIIFGKDRYISFKEKNII